MKTYEFSVVASGLDPEDDAFEQRFYDVGCDDATISFQRGRIILDFAREAESFDHALASAIVAVRAAGARVIRIEPDPLVSLADIAARVGMSRAAMTQYAKGQRGRGFPAPAVKVTSESPLWDWASVSAWLLAQDKVEPQQVVEAELLKRANEMLAGSNDALRDSLGELAAAHAPRLASGDDEAAKKVA
ncbi:DNA-binding protein [Methylopila jiangsuensis]|uniref:DNA-binding protein n=1 Tax=Methylopila jiangsuensis TaxID=586230 RepID=A0A9W6JEB5_9HYPH|nr:hypothetical protein [Methylopila jiangsuensis]MDR6286243.1 putative DNA-binding transcriptional regulator AlpA [Methylopila jiangsuensis]GLK76006.1 DNA-binding protein [Methylopila jiangsuensis]